MFLKRLFICLSLITILAAGCAGSNVTAQPQAAEPTQAAAATQAEPTQPAPAEPTAAPTAAGENEASTDDASAGGGLKGALILTGQVETEIGWTTEELKAMPTATGQGKNNKGEVSAYTGVLVADLLKLAAPKAGAAVVVFKSDNAEQFEAPLADLLSCADCIVTFRSQGGLSLLLPFLSEQLAMKGLKQMEVK